MTWSSRTAGGISPCMQCDMLWREPAPHARRCASAHPFVTVVAIWDTEEGGVRFYTMPGHNFGLAAGGASPDARPGAG